MKNFNYYDFTYEPIDAKNIGGSTHTMTFKAIDYEHALKQAKKHEKFKVDGKQVYKLVLKQKLVDYDYELLGRGDLVIYGTTEDGLRIKIAHLEECLNPRASEEGICNLIEDFIEDSDEFELI